jgi:hypothetical protein
MDTAGPAVVLESSSVNGAGAQEAKKGDTHRLGEADAQSLLEGLAAQPIDQRADAVEALISRLERELEATGTEDTLA